MAGREISIRALAASLDRTEGAIRLWVRDGLLVKVGEQCAEPDAIQAAVVDYLLRRSFSHDLVRGIMNGIRKALRQAAPNTRLRIVCHPQRHAGALIVGDAAAADAAVGRRSSTGRSVLILDIAQEVALMREDFQGAMDARSPADTYRR